MKRKFQREIYNICKIKKVKKIKKSKIEEIIVLKSDSSLPKTIVVIF